MKPPAGLGGGPFQNIIADTIQWEEVVEEGYISDPMDFDISDPMDFGIEEEVQTPKSK